MKASATIDLDDTDGLLDADRDGLLRAAASAGAQVRATAAAVEEGALASLAGDARPRTIIWVAGRGPAEAAGAMVASFVWFFGLAFGARLLGRWLATVRAWQVLDGVIAVVMIGLGVSLVLPGA